MSTLTPLRQAFRDSFDMETPAALLPTKPRRIDPKGFLVGSPEVESPLLIEGMIGEFFEEAPQGYHLIGF